MEPEPSPGSRMARGRRAPGCPVEWVLVASRGVRWCDEATSAHSTPPWQHPTRSTFAPSLPAEVGPGQPSDPPAGRACRDPPAGRACRDHPCAGRARRDHTCAGGGVVSRLASLAPQPATRGSWRPSGLVVGYCRRPTPPSTGKRTARATARPGTTSVVRHRDTACMSMCMSTRAAVGQATAAHRSWRTARRPTPAPART